MSADPTSSPIFSGTVYYSLDAKNRVTIPARWRLTDADEFFLMPDRTNTFLRAMPPKQFRAVAAQVESDSSISPRDRAIFKRQFFSGSVHVVADKQGRMLVPDEFCQLLELRGEVVFIGVNDTFEVWNRQRLESAAPMEALTYDRVAELVGL